MKLHSLSLILATALVFTLAAPTNAIGSGQKGKKNPPKAPPKTPPAKPKGTETTKGTVQLAGDNGKVGVTYQLGDKDSELHFTLDSIELGSRYGAVDESYVAGPEGRLLIFNCTVQNPLKADSRFSWNSFKFTAVSPEDENFTYGAYPLHSERLTRLDMSLKPAQKSKFKLVLPIYANGPITKVIVERGKGAVLRYDLRDKTPKLVSVFSPDGLGLKNDATAELGKPFDLGGLDFTVEEFSEGPETVGAYKSYPSKSLYTAVVKVANPLMKAQPFSWAYVKPTLSDANGEAISWASDFVSMASGTTIQQDIEPGGFVRGRYMFSGPPGLTPVQLKLYMHSTKRSVTIKK